MATSNLPGYLPAFNKDYCIDGLANRKFVRHEQCCRILCHPLAPELHFRRTASLMVSLPVSMADVATGD